eukprot:3910671-Ditylum_brightwellii.AAC.1
MFCTVRKFGSPLAIAEQLNTNISANDINTRLFESFLRELPAHVKQLLGNLQADNVNVGYWIDAINSGLATIAIDGSGPCDGAKTLMTSCRVELTDILSALYLLCAMAEFSKSEILSAQTLLCDNSAAVSYTNTPIHP